MRRLIYYREGVRRLPVYRTFSQRQQPEAKIDTYRYNLLPREFRIQVIHILNAALGDVWAAWRAIHNTMCRSHGYAELSSQFSLGNQPRYRVAPPDQSKARCQGHLINAPVSDVLDIIEIAFSVIERREDYYDNTDPVAFSVEQASAEAIEELNFRFRQHRLGYEYVDGRLIRIDSQYLHEEAVKPALGLLHVMAFTGPSEEFMKAHEHYRHRRNKEAMNEALKAFESTMKAICDDRGWAYRPTANASDLVQVLLNNQLVPQHLQAHFNALRSILESGLPTLRNKQSGHGQGSQPVEAPDYLARYAINLAATNIVLLVEAHLANPERST